MFFLLPLIGVAVGAAVGAIVTHAAGEKDRQAAAHQRKVANELTNKYSNLKQRYNQFVDESKKQVNENNKQINNLTRQHAIDEAAKDFRDIAIELQNKIILLMLDVDKNPSSDALNQLKVAIKATNQVLSQLNRSLIPICDDYFTRNLIRCAGEGEAIDSSTFSSLLDEWLRNEELHIRIALAFDFSTPTFVLEKLARDRDAEVREAVADNPFTPTLALNELANDSINRVRETARHNYVNQIGIERKPIKLLRSVASSSSMPNHLL